MSDLNQNRAGAGRPLMPAMLYPNEYVWFIFVSTLDLILTWAILQRDGTEVNPIAELVIKEWGFWGAIGFKFALMLFVILACEHIGRSRPRLGRWLARFAVFVSALPPLYSLGLLSYHVWSVSTAPVV